MGGGLRTASLLMYMEVHISDRERMEFDMNERAIILDALLECRESLEYAEKRFSETKGGDRIIRNSLKDRATNASVKMETIIELAFELGIISEEESLMEPDALIKLIDGQGW
jgi:hypothetical protein